METQINYYRQQLDLRAELDDATAAAEQVQALKTATPAMRANMWLAVVRIQERIAELQPLVDAQLEAADAAVVTEAAADAVETAVKILAAAKKITERNALLERTVRVWAYAYNSDFPEVWGGEERTVERVAKELHIRCLGGERPRVTTTWEGYAAFTFRHYRLVIKGATADELRRAWKAGARIVPLVDQAVA